MGAKGLKDHEIQELVNLLTKKLRPLTAVQSLRERIHGELVPYLESKGLRIDAGVCNGTGAPPEYEEKFTVINKKHNRALMNTKSGKRVLLDLVDALNAHATAVLIVTGRDITTNKYYVCNQDESYAADVLKIILGG